ncbi:MAG: HdeD family acid-resistance protein [Verrucomicrobiaceae bacterium]|nr:MAG: HdeD family acid-resistance protein [Verrucomicrobiaceae bacterium]
MLNDIAKYWWLMLIRGVAAITFGVLAWIWPGMTWIILLTFYAVFCLVEGISALSLGLTGGKGNRIWWQMLLVGCLAIGAGIVTVFWPGLTSLVLVVVIASWAIVRGIVEIGAAFRLRHEVHGEWMLALAGFLSILFGGILLARPGIGLLSIIWMMAAFAVTTGILLILFSLKLHHLKQHGEAAEH